MNPKSSISSFPILFGYVNYNCVFIFNIKHIINTNRFVPLANISSKNICILDVIVFFLECIRTTMHYPIQNTGLTPEYEYGRI